MSTDRQLPEGATIAAADLDRIHDALDALEKDPHAARSLSVAVNLHIHKEFPKTLSRQKPGQADGDAAVVEHISVANEDEEDEARADGYVDASELQS